MYLRENGLVTRADSKIVRADWHTHTHKSNLLCRDSTNFESDLIDKALELGLVGIGITDHGNISAHVACIQHLMKLRKEADEKVKENPGDASLIQHKKKIDEFKLGLGTEIYLVHREEVEEARANYKPTRFYHLIVIAKNKKGHYGLRKLSSNAWENSFFYRGMERIPTYYDYFIEWAKEYGNDVIITTACLGSEFSRLCLDYIMQPNDSNQMRIINFVSTMKKLFNDNFYIEIQPSHYEEQIAYNQLAISVAKSMGVKVLINTDAHYLSEDMKEIHSIYLKSQNAERETEQFYASCYLMSVEHLRTYFNYLDKESFVEFMKNSVEVADKIEFYDLREEVVVPKTTIGFDERLGSILAPIIMEEPFRSRYNYIYKYGTSNHLIDRALLQQIEFGLIHKKVVVDEEVLDRINVELEALWEISEKLHQRMASYYLLTKEIVQIMWEVSLVGVSRGSAGAFYICYLLDICQINPIKSAFDLPYWRHIDKSKIELADIDLDTEKGQRGNILEKVKEKFGKRRVLNICTFKTEGTASSIQTMCRGMGISTEDSAYISSLVVDGKSIKDCLRDYETDRECSVLIKEMMKYEGLVENVIAIEGLVCGRSVHASGIYIFNDDYDVCNSMMKAPKGQYITQFDMLDSDYQGGLKLDFLTVECLDRIRKCMDIMVEDKVLIWQGSIKETYNKYLHPDVIDYDSPILWKMLRSGEIIDAFQYDSVQGVNAISIIEPNTFQQLCDGNALMRLSCDGEQPINKYKRFKIDINQWYKEMEDAGLNPEEIETMKEHLKKSFGIAPTQESVMRLAMDSRIANFNLIWANKLRKAIAKSYAKDLIEGVHKEFVNQGVNNGNREVFLNYVWNSCIVPQLGYAFSEPHIMGYTLILMQEMNLAKISLLHWKVACLCVNSGDINADVNNATDYGAIGKAIARMEKGFVIPPDINISTTGFKADTKRNKALYGLSAISGINHDIAKQLIGLRPFNSFNDFINRCVVTKVVQPRQVYNLIKAGAFDGLNRDRIGVMSEFVSYLVPEKNKLTSANIPKMFSYGMIPVEYMNNYGLYLFKKDVFAKENLSRAINKTHGIYKVVVNPSSYGLNIDDFMDAVEYDDDANLCLNSKEFDKLYKIYQKHFDEWIKSKEALDRFNYCCRKEIWDKYCNGTIAKWEMDAICYYTDKHELEEMQIMDYYDIKNFNNLPREPIYNFIENPRNRKVYKKFDINLIAGVILEKNKAKSMITIATLDGVADVKLHRESFATYDRKTPEEDSWLKRGNKIIISGYRRGEVFVPKTYKDSIFKQPIALLEKNGETIRVRDVRKVDNEYEESILSYF